MVDKALAALREAGVEAEKLETNAPGSAALLAGEAAARGCDTIIACGGDGTVHEVLQALVGTEIALGVIPLGTANALASDIGLRASPLTAVRRLLTAEPTLVPVGRISYRNERGDGQSRYFTVAAGVGADALFLSRLDAGLKRRLGYILYLIEGFKIWATHSFPLFEAVFEESANHSARVVEISQLLAIRISDFGGVLHQLAPGATLHNEELRLVAFKTRSRFHYFKFLLAVMFKRQTFNGQIEILDAVSVVCRPRNRSKKPIFAEADGELLGNLPATLEIVPEAVYLLIPPKARA
jgi:diacylglycerol kinase family enzyme